MEVKPGYQRTEVGVIPEEWEMRPCSEVSERITVGIVIRPSQYYVRHGVPAFRSANIREDGIDDSDLVFISDASNATLAKSQTRTDDVLTVRTGYPGTSAVVRNIHSGCNCIDILITRPSQSLINSDWLAIWVNSPFGKEQVLRNQGGLAQKHFNVGDMRNLVVAIPPLPEQRAIATALSDVDVLIDSLDRLIAKKRDLKQAAMQQLLTGKKRLPGFAGEWEVKRLGDIAALRRENVVPASSPTQLFVHFSLPAFDAGGVPTVELGRDIGSNKFRVPQEAVLVSKLNPRIPRVWVPMHIPENAIASTEFLILLPKESVSRGFLHVLCSSAQFGEQMELAATGTTGSHQRINPNDALNIVVSVPSVVGEQTALADVLSDMDAEIAALEARRDKTRALKQGMMQELLTGRTRLV